nr:MAG TPA: hypothetical protein [Caudoviricetes sp.]
MICTQKYKLDAHAIAWALFLLCARTWPFLDVSEL